MRKKITKLLALALVGGAMSMAVACNQPPPSKTYFDVTLNGVTESVEKDGLLSEPMPLEDYELGGCLYVFEGWQYTDSEGETKLWDFDVDKVTGDVTLTPKFERREIVLNVTFKNGDTTISTTTVNKSSGKVTEPTIDKTYDDEDANKRYTFQHWYVLNNGVEKRWNFAVDKVIEDNTVIYAKYSSVPLAIDVVLNGETVKVNYGETLTKPEVDPVKADDAQYSYKFMYYICNGNIYDFSTPVKEPITVTAYFKKTERVYNISIDLDNGTVINRENVPFGALLSDYTPISITKDSTVSKVYTFSHFEDADGNTVEAVNGSASYKAIYTENVRQYNITTVIDGKETTTAVDYGSDTLATIGTPEKTEDDDASYVFEGWLCENGDILESGVLVESDATYAAQFTPIYKRYEITFDYAGKTTKQKINVGEKLVDYLPTETDKPTDPVAGKIYTFSHWEDSKGNTVNDETVVSDFETYTAIYDERDYNGTMSISDVVVATKECGRYIPVIFSKKGFTAPLTYTFEGNDISISDKGFITVNNVGKTVVVTAKNEENEMEDTFTVKTYDKLYDYTSTFGTKYAINNNFGGRFATHKADIEAKLNKETPSIVFMGDSFFDAGRYNAPGSFWSNFYTTFAGKNAYSFGVSGARSDEITAWVSAVAQYTPKSLVIHVGTNDIYDLDKNGTKTAQDVVDMLATVHNALPNTHIYYISVEYRTAAKANNAYEDESNAAAKAYCDNTDNVTYLDSLPYFTTTGVSKGGYIDSSKLRPNDGVHIALENYSVYINLLKEAGVNFDDYVIKVLNPIQKACGDGEVTLSGDTLTINNAGKSSRTRAYLYDTANQKHIQGNVAVWGTLNMKDIVVANNQFAEILLMEKPDNTWATANNYNIIDIVVRKHANQSVVKPIVWGYGIGGENSAYKWDDNDYTIEFSLVVYDKKAYVTLDGVTKMIELKSDALYIGFGSENLNYTVTGFTVSTNADVIESKLPVNRVINDVEDYTTVTASGVEANKKFITVGTDPLAGEFVIEGNLEFLEKTATNPHVEFKLNNNNSNRFLLWDNKTEGNFKISAIMGGKTTLDDADANDIIVFEKNKTISWKVVVYDGDYYWYINDELRLVNKNGLDVTSFNISSENVGIKFSGMKVYMKSNDPNGFAAQVEKIQADITASASLATGVTRV